MISKYFKWYNKDNLIPSLWYNHNKFKEIKTMRKLIAVILSVALLCSCNKKSEKIVPTPDSVDNNLQVSENTDSITYPSNYLAEEITVEGWEDFHTIKYYDKNLYSFAEHPIDYTNTEYLYNNLTQNTTHNLQITSQRIIQHIVYYENIYYTLEYDDDNVLHLCSYDSNSEKLKASVEVKEVRKLIRSGDYLYYLSNSKATLYDQNLREIHTIDLHQDLSKFYYSQIDTDENHNIYFLKHDDDANVVKFSKLNYDGTFAYNDIVLDNLYDIINNDDDYNMDDYQDWYMKSFVNEDKFYVYCYSWSKKTGLLNVIDTSTGEILTNHKIKNADDISVGYDNYDFCIEYEDDIYGLDIETMERTFLYDLSDYIHDEKKDIYLHEWSFINKELILITSQRDGYYCAIFTTDNNFNIKNIYQIPGYIRSNCFFYYNNEIYGITSRDKIDSFNIIKSSDGINFSKLITISYTDKYHYTLDLWIDEENNYSVVYDDIEAYYLQKFDATGKMLSTKPLPIYEYLFHKTHTDGEKIFFEDENYNLYSMDLQQNMKTERLYSSDTYHQWFDTSLNPDTEIFAYSPDNKTMNVFDLSYRKMKELFDFNKLPLEEITDFVQISDNQYILAGKREKPDKMELYKITISDEKYYKTLTIAGHNIPTVLKEQALNFSNEHLNTRIIYEECTNCKHNNLYTTAYHELDGAIMSKNIPDIILFDGCSDYRKYEDLLLDITEYVKDYKNNFYDYAFKVADNGSLTHFIPYIYDTSAIYLNNTTDFFNYFESNDLQTLIDYIDLNKDYLCTVNSWSDMLIDLYINENRDFNTDTFKDILKCIKYIDELKKDNNFVIPKMSIKKYEIINRLSYEYAGVANASFIINDFTGLAISKSSENKDIALEFLNYIMQNEAYENILKKNEYIIYTNKKALEKNIIARTKSENYSHVKKRSKDFLSLFDKNVIFTKKDTQLFFIVKNEVNRFLDYNLTVEETIENIQSKVSAK